MAAQGYAAYKEARVTTASGGRLIVMLYDAAINHLTLSIEAIETRAYEDAHNHLVKAQDILSELMDSLDMKYEVSHGLYALYEYCTERLIAANMAKESEPVTEVLGYLSELRDSWKQALKGDQQETQPQSERGAVGIEISG